MTTVENMINFKHSADVIKESVSRKKDIKNEEMLRIPFDKIYHNCNMIYEREEDKKEQIGGVDLYLYHKGKVVRIDEKAATSCYNRDLQTFSFELMFTKTMKNGHQTVYPGWFSSNSQISDAYMLGYVRAPENNENFKKIDSLEVILVKKCKLWKYIKQCGYESAGELLEIFNDAVSNNKAIVNNERKTVSLKLNGGLKLIQSFKMQESPINILIPKDTLMQLSSFHSKMTVIDDSEKFTVYKPLNWKKS